jgi:hypothetical protein
MTTLLKSTLRPLLAIASVAIVSCSTGVEMPKGTSKGYTSARLVQRNPNLTPNTATQAKVHPMIQKSIAKQFTSHGISYGKNPAELTVAYLVIYQEPGMTARYEDYFGYGRSTDEIADLAHTRGVIDNKKPDYFKRAGIVVDVIDSSTNKLVYRNFAAGDVVTGASDATRTARIDTAVGQALQPFFEK